MTVNRPPVQGTHIAHFDARSSLHYLTRAQTSPIRDQGGVPEVLHYQLRHQLAVRPEIQHSPRSPAPDLEAQRLTENVPVRSAINFSSQRMRVERSQIGHSKLATDT